MSVTPAVLFSEEQIRSRLIEVAKEIDSAYAGKEVAVVGLMKSCLIFTADMLRTLTIETTCHFLRASAVSDESGAVRTNIVYSGDAQYEDRHVLLLDDIVDTGITLNFVLEHIVEHHPASLRVCALLDKPGERKVDVAIDWALFRIEKPIENSFIVGYGLDFQERFRGVPYIGTIPRSGPKPAERTLTLSGE
jgi:hypoxanthine phosphoribosyltransferase